jgi:hypothetical protein
MDEVEIVKYDLRWPPSRSTKRPSGYGRMAKIRGLERAKLRPAQRLKISVARTIRPRRLAISSSVRPKGQRLESTSESRDVGC